MSWQDDVDEQEMESPLLTERFRGTVIEAGITKVIFHPESSWMVSLSLASCESIMVWDFESGGENAILDGHTARVLDIAFNQKGTLLASCSQDDSIKMWYFGREHFSTPDLFECVRTIMMGSSAWSIAFSPWGERVYSGGHFSGIKAWGVDTGDCSRLLEGRSDRVSVVRVSAAGILAFCCFHDPAVYVWRPVDAECEPTELRGHLRQVNCLSWAPASAAAAIREASGGDDPRGALLASGSRDKTVKIWDVSARRCLATLAGHTGWVLGVAWLPGGRHLLSASNDDTLRVWDVARASCVRTIDTHQHHVSCLDVHRSLPFVVSGSTDKIVKGWNCPLIKYTESEKRKPKYVRAARSKSCCNIN